MELRDLLNEDESEWLDFKEKFHVNNVEMLHDILCLANSYSYVETDRYLVFGIKNDKSICGVEADSNRKTNANVQDLMRQSNLNRVPTVRLCVENRSGHIVAILEIKNRPDKPFFVTKDKTSGKSVLRAGVVYTRLGDTNTPLKESAPEEHIELMWRERFGLGLAPLARLYRLLDEKENWVTVGGESYLYHKEFPEFTIRDGETLNENFVEPWTRKFPDPHAYSYHVEIRYLTTVLKKTLFISCDGGRYSIPAPKRVDNEHWVIQKRSLEYKIASICRQYWPLSDVLASKGVQII